MLRHSTKLCALSLCASVAALVTASPALAQDTPASPPQATANPTEAAVGNLLQGLVDQGVLKRAKAQALMNKFHSDITKAPAQPQAAPAATSAADDKANIHVPYIPDIVKDEITNRVKQDVVQQAKDEHWATPNSFPEWVSRIKIFGDFRFRDEGRYFNPNNELAFVDVNYVNNNGGYNTGSNNTTYPAILNSSKDRNTLRIRARLGFEAAIADDWTAVFRLASGSDNSPVSTNQTLGGFFSKKSIWLDQAFIKYEPAAGDALIVGRMPNPFVRTEMVWSENVNPDGIALKLAHDFTRSGLGLHAVGGAFSLDYSGDSYPTTALSNAKSGMDGDKWLFAGQVGASYDVKPLKLSFDAAYYDFDNIQGKLSPSCSNEGSYCTTDWSKPAFMQKGNTLFSLRQFYYPTSTDVTATQLYGLASKFEVLDLIAKADYAATDTLHISLTGDVARNLAYSQSAITALPIVNNNETCSGTVPTGKSCSDTDSSTGKPYGTAIFKSGKDAWFLRLDVGAPKVTERWDWNVSASYEYIQPDALLDAFTDSDFHLGGTNAKGWTIGGNLGLAHNTWLSAKWLSADAVTGPVFSVDVLQVDLNVRF